MIAVVLAAAVCVAAAPFASAPVPPAVASPLAAATPVTPTHGGASTPGEDSARFLVGFRSYAGAEVHERSLRALWAELPPEGWAAAHAGLMDARSTRATHPTCPLVNANASASAAYTCSIDGWMTPCAELEWTTVARPNAAAGLPTDFLLVRFTGAASRDSIRTRAIMRLHELVAMHPQQLKYAQEDARVSRALFQAPDPEPEPELDPAAKAESERERLRLQAELDAISAQIESVKRRAAETGAPVGDARPHSSSSTPQQQQQQAATTPEAHVPTPGGVGDFPAPQRFDLARGAAAVSASLAEELESLETTGASLRRRLCQWGGVSGNLVTELLQASKLWDRGYTGRGIRIAIFDTGLSKTHAHFRHVDERTNWTDEHTLEDGLGHGTFVAGVVAAQKECAGFAPDASLHIFRVFNQRQLSFTSWFLDAFNYAIHSKVHVLNLSIGGPDFLDRPFVDKVNEMSANGITVVSAIGNDGPLWGTLNNPADQMDVVGVGGVNEDGRISAFSSRGMTTWELPQGYGRMKPDIVALARNIRGSNVGNGCKTMSGTSVASPVVAGCVTLLASVVPESERASKLNPAFLKQLLMESSSRVGSGSNMPGIFEQGVGSISLLTAFALLTDPGSPFVPHASIVPSKLDLTDCPYMWPYCTQALYYSAQPVVVNMTVLNSQAVASFLPADAPPRFHLANEEPEAQEVLRVWFTYPDSFWPWSGYFAVHLALRRDIPSAMLLSGFVEITLQTDDEFATRSVIKLPLRVSAAPTPPRSQRILFDSFHNLRYPSGYFPRDNLEVKIDTLDWNGDHVHTNYRELYTSLRAAGYFVEVLGTDWTCFDASRYGTLLLIDPEEEYFHEELQKLHDDVYHDGLNLLVLAEWYNAQVMREIKFYDENTAEWWTPETGGANLPALNQVLAGFGVQLGDHVVKGEVTVNGEKIYYASGTTITKFPQSGYLLHHHLTDGGSAAPAREYPILGAYAPAGPGSPLAQTYPNAGRLVVYGDSNCVDMNHRRGSLCAGLVLESLRFLQSGIINPRMFPAGSQQPQPFLDPSGRKPRRVTGNNLVKYSKVISPGSKPLCPLVSSSATGGQASEPPMPYAAQHALLLKEVVSDDGKASTRFHSALQKLSSKHKQRQQQQREHNHEYMDAEDEQWATDTPGADLRPPGSEGAGGGGAGHAGASGASSSSSSDPAGHVLSKQARLGALANDNDEPGADARETADLFAAAAANTQHLDAMRLKLAREAGRDARQRWIKIVLFFVMLAMIVVAWLYRKQMRARVPLTGKRSPATATRTLAQPQPQSQAQQSAPTTSSLEQRTTVL